MGKTQLIRRTDAPRRSTVRTVSVDAVNTGLPEAVRLTIRAVRDNYSYLLKK